MDTVRWQIDRHNPVTVIRLDGHLRPRSVPGLRAVLLKCLAECPTGLVVDLAELTVSQPVLLAVFPAVLERAASWPAIPVVLAAPNDATTLALRRSPAAKTVPVRPTVEEAIQAAGRGAPLGRLRLYLQPTVASPGEARRFTRDACAAWHLEAVVDEAAVLVTELTDNAATHARTPFVLTLSYREHYLHIAVHDGAPAPARKHTGSAEPLLGRGLRLVDAFATAWGTLPTAEGKTTWATLRVH
ncbi:ATP-binding protein [Cryptosporangium sp. NPDC051539]|uniref:ATP-binding protein n=1 Tax=Cryptosporangium sp. NPDC051539 TaxID=3363962 RepID=UPI00379730E9